MLFCPGGRDTRSNLIWMNYQRLYPLRETIKEVFKNILAVSIDDGTQMRIKGIESIHDEADYNGLRVSLEALFDGIRTPLKIDITVGDKITPRETLYRFNLMFEERQIDIFVRTLNSSEKNWQRLFPAAQPTLA
jgi:activator of HSP90 ATPase